MQQDWTPTNRPTEQLPCALRAENLEIKPTERKRWPITKFIGLNILEGECRDWFVFIKVTTYVQG